MAAGLRPTRLAGRPGPVLEELVGAADQGALVLVDEGLLGESVRGQEEAVLLRRPELEEAAHLGERRPPVLLVDQRVEKAEREQLGARLDGGRLAIVLLGARVAEGAEKVAGPQLGVGRRAQAR